MKKIAAVLMFLCLSTFLKSQSGVNGTTVDSKGEPVPFILVVADSGKKFTQTDFEGKFSIDLKLTSYL